MNSSIDVISANDNRGTICCFLQEIRRVYIKCEIFVLYYTLCIVYSSVTMDCDLPGHTDLCAMPFILMCAIPSSSCARRSVATRTVSFFSWMYCFKLQSYLQANTLSV